MHTLPVIICAYVSIECTVLYCSYCDYCFSPLTHTLYPVEETEICLITKEDKSSVKTLLEERSVQGVTKVRLW